MNEDLLQPLPHAQTDRVVTVYDHNFMQSKEQLSFKNATLEPLLTPRVEQQKELTYLITVQNNIGQFSPNGESPYMKMPAQYSN